MSSIKYLLFYLCAIYAKIFRAYDSWWRNRILKNSLQIRPFDSTPPSVTLKFKTLLSCIDDDGNDLLTVIDDLLTLLEGPLTCSGDWLVHTFSLVKGLSNGTMKSRYIHIGYLADMMLVEQILPVDKVISILPY